MIIKTKWNTMLRENDAGETMYCGICVKVVTACLTELIVQNEAQCFQR